MVNDGSTDASWNILSNWRDSRIKLFQHFPNSGKPAVPQNIAINKSTGAYIALLGADDIWEPDNLQRQVEFLENHLDIAFLSSNLKVLYDSAKKVGPCIGKQQLIYPTAADIYCSNPFLASATIIRSFAVKEVGGFDEKMRVREDWELAMRISLKYRTAFNGKHIAGFYRIHENNISHTLSSFIGMDYIREKHDHNFPKSLLRDVHGRDCYNMARDALRLGDKNTFEEQISNAADYRFYYRWKGLFLKYKHNLNLYKLVNSH